MRRAGGTNGWLDPNGRDSLTRVTSQSWRGVRRSSAPDLAAAARSPPRPLAIAQPIGRREGPKPERGGGAGCNPAGQGVGRFGIGAALPGVAPGCVVGGPVAPPRPPPRRGEAAPPLRCPVRIPCSPSRPVRNPPAPAQSCEGGPRRAWGEAASGVRRAGRRRGRQGCEAAGGRGDAGGRRGSGCGPRRLRPLSAPRAPRGPAGG